MSINDNQLSFLRSRGYTGALNDAYRAYASDLAGTDQGTINDLLFKYFEGLGFPGSLDDKILAYGKQQGLTGTINDILERLWATNGLLSYPLNAVTSASAAAYSLRKLKNTYTGSAIRVRRSVDNAETDIGFTSNGDLDTTALSNFVGSQNLLQHSEAFDNAYWSKSASFVTATNIASPIGTSDAELINFLSGGLVSVNLTGWTAGTIATVSVWVKRASSGSASHFYITTNNASTWNTGQSTKVLLTNQWQRVSLSGNLVTSGTSLGVRFGARDIAGNVDPDCVGNVEMWGAQLNTGTLQPYSPTTRRNLLTFTEAFDNAIWESLPGSAETVNANNSVAPDGTTTADTCTVTTATSGRFQYFTLASAGQITFSVYVKSGGTGAWLRVGLFDQAANSNQARCWVNMSTGTLGTVNSIGTGWSGVSATSTSVGNGWYRVSITATCTATAISTLATNANSDGDTNRTVGQNRILWGAQLELGSTSTEYQRVDGAWASTRDGNGFITTWYDQSDNARNATQATAGNQPSIVTNGVVNIVNGKPVLLFKGSEWLSFSSLTLTDFATIWVSRKRDATVVSQSIILARSGLSRPYAGDDVNGLGNPNVSGAGSDIVRTTLGNTSPSGGEDALHTSYAQRIGNQATGGMNGQVNPNATVETTSMILNIIGRYTNLETFNYVGDLTELMIMTTALSTVDRQTIERNQGSYYNITVS